MSETEIIDEIKELPENLKTEVLHFVKFLKSEYNKPENGIESENSSKKENNGNKRVFGRSKGKYIMAPDFDEPLEDFKEYI